MSLKDRLDLVFSEILEDADQVDSLPIALSKKTTAKFEPLSSSYAMTFLKVDSNKGSYTFKIYHVPQDNVAVIYTYDSDGRYLGLYSKDNINNTDELASFVNDVLDRVNPTKSDGDNRDVGHLGNAGTGPKQFMSDPSTSGVSSDLLSQRGFYSLESKEIKK